MRILRYDKVTKSDKSWKIANELRERAMLLLAEHYDFEHDEDAERYAINSLVRQLPFVVPALSDNLERKTILDLGCGSTSHLDGGGLIHNSGWDPWLCRGLYHLGYDVIGVDMGDLDNEPFKHYKARLHKEKALVPLSDASMDLVNAYFLFNSPSLEWTRTNPDRLKEV